MTRSKTSIQALGFLALFAATASMANDSEEASAAFSYKPVSKWNFEVPGESWIDVKDLISMPNDQSYKARVFGAKGAEKLELDTNGDGRFDVTCKGRTGSAKLRGVDADGKSFNYSIRLAHSGSTWKCASGGVMKGSVDGHKVTLIDANCNGRWNDQGVDCYVSGKGKAATPITEALSLGGKLYALELESDGRAGTWEGFQGETGTLNLAKQFEGQGDLVSALVKSTDGRFQFNLAGSKKGLVVPAGTYNLKSASLKKKNLSAKISKGSMQAFEVPAAGAYALEWGGPITVVYDWTEKVGKITVSPSSLKFVGKAGEVYSGFAPSDIGPKFFVTDLRNKKKLASGRFKLC